MSRLALEVADIFRGHGPAWRQANAGVRLKDRWKPAIQLDEEQAIAVRELDRPRTLRCSTNQLLPANAPLLYKDRQE